MADVKPSPGIQPLPLLTAQTGATKPDAPSLDEKVDEWLVAHPAEKTFDESPPTPVATTEESTVPPGGEQPSTESTAPPPSGTPEEKPTPPTVTPTTPPTAEPQAKVEPQPPQAKPEEKPAAAAAPIRFSLDAKYKFSDDGPEWSGQQVVDGLRERSNLIPKAQEADVYRETFEMPAAQAKELWAPNLVWLRSNPLHVQMIAQMIDDDQKAQYLLGCSQYWDSPEGQQLRAQAAQQQPVQQQPAAKPQPAALHPDVEARIKQLEEAEHFRKQRVAMERVTRDLNTAFHRYPYLRDNPHMVEALLQRAKWLNNGDDSDNAKGILDALDMEKDLYDAKLHALNGATQIVAEAAAPIPVPPLMGSAGAAPQASASTRAQHPKNFGTLDDAVDEWMKNPPPQFR
jgi:hypothetical protein